MKIKSRIGFLIISIILILILSSFVYMFFFFDMFPSKECSVTEVKRLSSPGSIVDAVLIETNSGATSSFVYKLYIVPKNKKIQSGYELFIADHVNELDINWKELKFLEIMYKQARIFKYSNFWQSDKVQDWNYVVELRLVPLTDSFSLSKSDRWIQ